MNWDYAAGFIDADGSVGFFREYKRQSVALTASQITRPVLEELRELIGLGQVYERPSERKGNMNTSKVLYIYRASGFKLLPPLKELAPRMIVKKQKCLEV